MVFLYFIGFIASIIGLCATDTVDENFNEWLASLLAFGVLYLAQCVRLHALRIKPMDKRR